MTVTINGTTGVAGVDGTAATPAIQGNDTNTGIFFPAADTIAFAEGGIEVMRIDSSGKILASAGTNWVGTVSQSTLSSVIESGSNANGSVTKFADGTQICRRTAVYTAGSITWASAFVNIDYHTIATNDTLSAVTTAVYGRTQTGISFSTNASANDINFIAIGRWY